MPNRIIKESICTSETLAKLSDFEENFFYKIIVNCDDFGRFDARPSILKSRCYPLRDRLTLKTIEDALSSLARVGCVELYEVDGKPYLHLPAWRIHQQVRATKSKFPAPDINGYQMISDAPVIVSESESDNENSSCPESSQATTAERDEEKKPKRTYDPDSKHYKAAKWLSEHILTSIGKAIRPHTEAQLQDWANTFRLMEGQDKLPWEDIRSTLVWAVSDSFWSAQIQSARGFRSHYNQLAAKMRQESTRTSDPAPTTASYAPSSHRMGEIEG